MTAKKKLITRMARWTGLVLAIALLVDAVSLLKETTNRNRWDALQETRRAELFESSQVYIDELAKQIDTTPVDPGFALEVESRYFDEYEDGPMEVWAMATDGSFLFGVPRESFSRLNAIYDREITPRLEDGVFFDRQSFFLDQQSTGESLLLLEASGDPSTGVEASDLWERISLHPGRHDDSFVLSAPLRTTEGVALGSIYLSRAAPGRDYYSSDERLDAVIAVATAVAVASAIFLWLLLPTWVYVDARERGVARAALFAFLTAVSSLIGLVVYLIARPENYHSLTCPGCDHEVNEGAFCPHCGRDLSNLFCQACRYPLEPEWSYCPSCRTEARPASDLDPSDINTGPEAPVPADQVSEPG